MANSVSLSELHGVVVTSNKSKDEGFIENQLNSDLNDEVFLTENIHSNVSENEEVYRILLILFIRLYKIVKFVNTYHC